MDPVETLALFGVIKQLGHSSSVYQFRTTDVPLKSWICVAKLAFIKANFSFQAL